MIFALVATATLVEGSAVKGILSASMGLMIATVGIDLQSGAARFTFGSPDLLDGIHLLTAIIGVYAITEVLVTVEQLSCGTFRTTETVGRMWASKAARSEESRVGKEGVSKCRLRWVRDH